MIGSMDVWVNTIGLIVVALISGGVALHVKRLDRHNTDQHGQNLTVLSMLNDKVEHVDGTVQKLAGAVDNIADDVIQVKDQQQNHLKWHLDQEADKVVDLQKRRQA